jgi:3-isopropylmalate dehydratase small subunit
MHTIQPARLEPGVTREAIASAAAAVETTTSTATIHGRALILWDLKVPGKKKKLDAIDTDQITPAADCVSESLDTLDERWKAGAFRYLMPDFRARVHRGETFVIAGDRFAIGSSREMSPAGLKGVAEEAGLELVVVCGSNMGDIFRRNAFNLGLHVVQSHEAVADAQEGDAFAFDPATRRLVNETRGKTYEPVPLTAKEDEIRQSGGIFALGRREFRKSVETKAEITWPDPSQARRMTTTEQIVWAHRVDKTAEVRPGATLRVYADLLPASDGTAPFSIHTFNQITGGHAIHPRQIAIANDHFVFTGKDADERQTSIGRAFAKLFGIGNFTIKVVVRAGHRLIEGGPYRTVRHPNYAGLVLVMLGTAMGLQSPLALAAVIFLWLPALLLRIRAEEVALGQQLGEEYLRYVQRTWRLVPGLY